MPARTVGLTIHLLYPLISSILLAIAAFASADSVWYVSANTASLTVGVTDECQLYVLILGTFRNPKLVRSHDDRRLELIEVAGIT